MSAHRVVVRRRQTGWIRWFARCSGCRWTASGGRELVQQAASDHAWAHAGTVEGPAIGAAS